MKFTHKGWFGLCPVYFADLESEAPHVHPRHWIFTPLMMLSEVFFSVAFWCAGFINPDFEPAWALRVTGALEEPADDGKRG